MTQKKLHPSVLKFKEFVKNNPNLIKEVRMGKATWQELYEDWYLLGEEDSRFKSLGVESIPEKEEKSSNNEADTKGDWKSNIMGMFKNMDANQIQGHINNLSQAIGAIQGVLSSFQSSNPTNAAKPPEGPKNPFSFRKD